MSEKEQATLDMYCQEIRRLIKLVYFLVTGIILGSVLILVSFGEVKAQGKETASQVEFINKNYVPTIFLEGMQQNYYYYIQEIVATVSNNPKKIKEIGEKYFEFQQSMTKQMINLRGGISSTTRGGSSTQPSIR